MDKLHLDQQHIDNLKDTLKDFKKHPKEYSPLIALTPGWVEAYEKLIHDWELMHEWLSDEE
jgi:hypothetical protein